MNVGRKEQNAIELNKSPTVQSLQKEKEVLSLLTPFGLSFSLATEPGGWGGVDVLFPYPFQIP